MEAPRLGVAPEPRVAKPARARSAAPPGALRGDLRRQPFSFRAPKPFFVDAERRCRGCGARFVLLARAQKRWCETLGLAPESRGARCPACLGAWLRTHGPQRRLADAARALAGAPLHAPAVLAYARASVSHAARFGHAPLDAALAALAMLAARGPEGAEALFWIGRCHEAAHRSDRAASAYRRLLESRPPAPARFRHDAARRLAGLVRGSVEGRSSGRKGFRAAGARLA